MNLYEGSAMQEDEVVEVTIEQLDAFRASCKSVIENSKIALDLHNSPEFQKVIMKDYFEEEPKRLGLLMASGKLTPSGFTDAVDDLRSIGHLQAYLSQQVQRGMIAQEELEQAEAAYSEAQEAELA